MGACFLSRASGESKRVGPWCAHTCTHTYKPFLLCQLLPPSRRLALGPQAFNETYTGAVPCQNVTRGVALAPTILDTHQRKGRCSELSLADEKMSGRQGPTHGLASTGDMMDFISCRLISTLWSAAVSWRLERALSQSKLSSDGLVRAAMADDCVTVVVRHSDCARGGAAQHVDYRSDRRVAQSRLCDCAVLPNICSTCNPW
ncbi:hypothetical protein K437DRAFT_178398 [Tilletiaria anomala UBC 951]|uniref:Uncharacterized protein n=1 Tax=Tilletiaria anomala (strain ATCC 24038 / CBS 436.72 / UBC 951) TaxID=1037660 RepID=A0A066VS30_TILAU|nr:uncharacterized protein K437DRAFT_178398 [Tilletiaria anomala UBC 951]KDN41335.1 hypothetical protein K437DRAFT_178398 [Tilletiaria anomala UBC 951]